MGRRNLDPTRVPEAAQVRNKAPASLQITAEQLLREAHERREVTRIVQREPVDEEDRQERLFLKRRDFENALRRNRHSIGTWIKYAIFEEGQKELERARSIYERALEVDPRNIALWQRYAEMEMKNKNVNLARNLWNRAITILPRVEQFWYKYAYMEEVLGNVNGTRQIYARWMEWEPPEQIWGSYIKFETRHNEWDKIRQIYEQFIHIHPRSKNWVKYAKFEEEQGNIGKAREIFERASDNLDIELKDQKFFVSFAKFETRQKEFDRAKAIYKFALDLFPKERAESLYNNYAAFEKQHGSTGDIEDAIISKRRVKYEEAVKENPFDYDAWFDYVRLEEAFGDIDTAREVYERAIANIPPTTTKQAWRRYIYLWIYYAIFEELVVSDMERTRAVYKACLALIPHKEFTFAKVWTLYAKFLIRRLELDGARKAFGQAIGICPKHKIFKNYIELELSLREFDRCRILYGKHLEFSPVTVPTWLKFIELENLLEEKERVRALYELGIEQPVLDMPELLWKSYIDFEVEESEYQQVRNLYERLLEKTENVKVWISYCEFEAMIGEIERARRTFERGYTSLKSQNLITERILLLESWKEFEENHGSEENAAAITAKFPKKVKKRRPQRDATGTETGEFEEYYDYIFPDDPIEAPHIKLLELAHKWKKQQANE